ILRRFRELENTHVWRRIGIVKPRIVKLHVAIGIAFRDRRVREVETAVTAEARDIRAEEKNLTAFGGFGNGGVVPIVMRPGAAWFWKACAKSAGYFVPALSVSRSRSPSRNPSSTGCSPYIGTSACFSSDFICGLLHVSEPLQATLTRLIAPRECDSPVAPNPTARPSVKASSCLWQVAQEDLPFTDRRVS